MTEAVNRKGRSHSATTALAAIALAFIAMLGLAHRAEAQPFQTGVFDTGAFLGTDSQIGYQRTAAAGGDYVKTFVYWDTITPGVEPASWNPRDPGDANYEF